MRPARYHEFLHAAITRAAADEPAITNVSTFAEAGLDDPRFGTVVTFASGAAIWWQTVFTSPDQQDNLEEPEQIVEGTPPPAPETARASLPTEGRIPMSVAEAWLVHVLLSQVSPEIRRAYARSQPPEPTIYKATSYGLAVDFHSGRSGYTLPMYTLPVGTDPRDDRRHKVLEQI